MSTEGGDTRCHAGHIHGTLGRDGGGSQAARVAGTMQSVVADRGAAPCVLSFEGGRANLERHRRMFCRLSFCSSPPYVARDDGARAHPALAGELGHRAVMLRAPLPQLPHPHLPQPPYRHPVCTSFGACTYGGRSSQFQKNFGHCCRQMFNIEAWRWRPTTKISRQASRTRRTCTRPTNRRSRGHTQCSSASTVTPTRPASWQRCVGWTMIRRLMWWRLVVGTHRSRRRSKRPSRRRPSMGPARNAA